MHLHTKEAKRVLAELMLGLLYKPSVYLAKQHCKWCWGLGMQESSSEFNPIHFFHVFFASRHHWYQLPWKMKDMIPKLFCAI